MKIKAAQQKFTDEFKEQAVKQVTEYGHKASEVASRLGVSTNSLYTWIKRYSVSPEERARQDGQHEETRRLKAELKRVSEERDILKKAAAYFARHLG